MYNKYVELRPLSPVLSSRLEGGENGRYNVNVVFIIPILSSSMCIPKLMVPCRREWRVKYYNIVRCLKLFISLPLSK